MKKERRKLFHVGVLRTIKMVSGCGLVGRAVASKTRGLQFKSGHRQALYIEHLFALNYFEKTKMKKKGPVMADIYKNEL